MMKRVTIGLLLALGACATAARDVPAVYFDESAYSDWTCEKITEELSFVTSRVDVMASQQEARRAVPVLENDRGVPNLARLKGQREALVRISERKRCVEAEIERSRSSRP